MLYFRVMGEHEKQAFLRQRDLLWARKAYLTPEEGRLLDELVDTHGKPDETEIQRKYGAA